jgi:alkanesulfonate monooxygenase SsuD/methylene tetrahydromethanopterin reductase-like flavin-dependent oxidoreductase (luciferase family)
LWSVSIPSGARNPVVAVVDRIYLPGMLSRFGTLFVGQVHHDDMGFDATPVNERWYDDEHLASPMQTTQDLAVLMDGLGYDTIWLAEHHFQREGYECIPNTLLMATHLAGMTKQIRFGCGFNVLPTWHPVRLAEDYAMADILTKGRVRMGVGRGYHTREVDLLQIPTAGPEDARELFEEQVELLMKALKERSFSHHGRFYDLPAKLPYRGYELEDLTLVPKPQFSTECWQPIVSATDRGLDFMLDHGIGGFVGGGAASGGASESVARRWQQKLAERGRDTELGTDLIFGFSFLLADSEDEAKKAGGPMLEEYQKMFAPLGFAGDVTDEQLEQIGTRGHGARAGLPDIGEAIGAGSWLVGPAEKLIDAFGRLQDTYPGLEEVMVAQPVGAQPAVVMEQMQRFGEEVMPAFKS